MNVRGDFLGPPHVFSYFPFGFEGRIWDLIVSVLDHCLSFYCAIKEEQMSHAFLIA